jgi:hypothetical protein
VFSEVRQNAFSAKRSLLIGGNQPHPPSDRFRNCKEQKRLYQELLLEMPEYFPAQLKSSFLRRMDD